MKLRYLVGLVFFLNINLFAVSAGSKNDKKLFKDLQTVKLLRGKSGSELTVDNNTTTQPYMWAWFPTYDWSFGCTPTAFAMVAMYWRRHYQFNGISSKVFEHNFDNNWGPLDNDPLPMTNSNCAVSATRKGINGFASNGHVEQFWASREGKADLSPSDADRKTFWGGQKQDCIADFLNTSVGSSLGDNGRTENDVPPISGMYVTKGDRVCDGFNRYLKVRANGKDVTTCHEGIATNSSFDYHFPTNSDPAVKSSYMTVALNFGEFKALIDEGIPVVLNVADSNNADWAHTLVAVGYWNDASGRHVYCRSTWQFMETEWLIDEINTSGKIDNGRIFHINWDYGTVYSGNNQLYDDIAGKPVDRHLYITEAYFFMGDDIIKSKYQSRARTFPRSNSAIELKENSNRKVSFDIADDDYLVGDSVKVDVFFNTKHGAPTRFLLGIDTVLSHTKSLSLDLPTFDFSTNFDNWSITRHGNVDGGVLVTKVRGEDTLYWVKEIEFKLDSLIAPIPEITLSEFEYKGKKGIRVFTKNSGGPIAPVESNGYYWNFGDGKTSVAAGSSHFYQNPGVYTISLKVKGVDGSEQTTSRTISISGDGMSIVSNDYLNQKGAMKARVDHSKLLINLANESDLSIKLFNMLGQQIKTVSLKSCDAGNHTIALNPNSDLAAGTYLVKVSSETETISTKALIY